MVCVWTYLKLDLFSFVCSIFGCFCFVGFQGEVELDHCPDELMSILWYSLISLEISCGYCNIVLLWVSFVLVIGGPRQSIISVCWNVHLRYRDICAVGTIYIFKKKTSLRCSLGWSHRYAILKWSSNESICFWNVLMCSSNEPNPETLILSHFAASPQLKNKNTKFSLPSPLQKRP